MLLVRENCHLYNAAGTQVRRDCDVVFNFYLDESAKLGDSLSQVSWPLWLAYDLHLISITYPLLTL